MTLTNKLILSLLGFVMAFALCLSFGVKYYKQQLEELQREAIWKAVEQKDSTRNADYIQWKNHQEKALDEFTDSLSVIHRKTIAAEKKAAEARKKADKAHEDRKLIHLHPDSLPVF